MSEPTPLAKELAKAARDLAMGMHQRVGRCPDIADYAVVIQRVLDNPRSR